MLLTRSSELYCVGIVGNRQVDMAVANANAERPVLKVLRSAGPRTADRLVLTVAVIGAPSLQWQQSVAAARPIGA
jgi:hypothetical protein